VQPEFAFPWTAQLWHLLTCALAAKPYFDPLILFRYSIENGRKVPLLFQQELQMSILR
jgi:hypothetical protein